jgi:hypothetical protein
VAAQRIGLVLEAPDGGEDAPVDVVPLLDLIVVPIDVRPELLEIRTQALLDRVPPRIARVDVRANPAELEQVVFDLVEDQRADVALRLVPVGHLARLESDELDREPFRGGTREDRRRLWEQLTASDERTLELVVGKSLGLALIPLGEELEIRVVVRGGGQTLVGHLPARRLAVLERREGMTETRALGHDATERPEFFASIRMPEAKPIPCRSRDCPWRNVSPRPPRCAR